MNDATPQAGHNLPSLAEILPLTLVEQTIGAEIAVLAPRVQEWVDSCKRFVAKYPTIEDVEADVIATEIFSGVQRLTSKTGRVETARVALKAPILAADQAIGSLQKGPFANLLQPLLDALKPITAASIAYKQKIEADRRKAAQEQAALLAKQAALAEELASQGSSSVTMADALAAAEAAETSQKIANSSAADLTRSRGENAGTASLRYKRVVTIVEPHMVPRQYCVPDIAALTRAAGKAGGPFPKINGVSISDVSDLTVRR